MTAKYKKYWPLVLLLLLGAVAYLWYCSIRGKPVVGIIGWSPYNTSPMPSSPAPSSQTMGMSVQAR